MLGAGAVTVFNQSRDAVETALKTMEFLAEESCGKCTPCREGTEALAEILRRIYLGQGRERDMSIMQEICDTMMAASLCGLGQAAPFPVLDTLEHFRSDYESRIKQEGGIAGC